jgi:serine phosphatase RsbU (regulator of sigma subunit)
MVRSGAWLGHRPDQVVAMADELSHEAGITETATLFCGRLTRPEPAAGGGAAAHLEYCNAGHLHPLLRDPSGRVTHLDGGNRILLGALGIGAPLLQGPVGHVVLPAGTVLLLYTDGLVERPGTSLEEATDQLVQALAGYDPATPLTEFCQDLLAGATARDDTTVFAVRVL